MKILFQKYLYNVKDHCARIKKTILYQKRLLRTLQYNLFIYFENNYNIYFYFIFLKNFVCK